MSEVLYLAYKIVKYRRILNLLAFLLILIGINCIVYMYYNKCLVHTSMFDGSCFKKQCNFYSKTSYVNSEVCNFIYYLDASDKHYSPNLYVNITADCTTELQDLFTCYLLIRDGKRILTRLYTGQVCTEQIKHFICAVEQTTIIIVGVLSVTSFSLLLSMCLLKSKHPAALNIIQEYRGDQIEGAVN
jgi:hypothetical protein